MGRADHDAVLGAQPALAGGGQGLAAVDLFSADRRLAVVWADRPALLAHLAAGAAPTTAAGPRECARAAAHAPQYPPFPGFLRPRSGHHAGRKLGTHADP